jgi:hypothetical protein
MPAGGLIPSSSVISQPPFEARTQKAATLVGLAAIASIVNKPGCHHYDKAVVAARKNENGSYITDIGDNDDTPVDHGAKVTMQSIAGPSARGIVFFATQPRGGA